MTTHKVRNTSEETIVMALSARLRWAPLKQSGTSGVKSDTLVLSDADFNTTEVQSLLAKGLLREVPLDSADTKTSTPDQKSKRPRSAMPSKGIKR